MDSNGEALQETENIVQYMVEDLALPSHCGLFQAHDFCTLVHITDKTAVPFRVTVVIYVKSTVSIRIELLYTFRLPKNSLVMLLAH